MNLEQFIRYTGEMFTNLRKTKIVFLRDDSPILEYMNNGTIPVFENGGELQARTPKMVGETEIMVRRPYLICYNRILNCNVAYYMTGGATRETIKRKMYHDQIETPHCFYDYIDASVNGGLDQKTHSAENIETVSTVRAVPIPMCITDQSELRTANYDDRNIPSGDIRPLRDFMSNFYGGENEKFITKGVKSGRAYDWFIDFGDKISYHRLSRPAVAYVAMFLNYAESELESPKMTDSLSLSQLKGLTIGATEAYLNHLRFACKLDEVRAKQPYVFREFMQIRNNAVKHIATLGYERAVMEEYSKSTLTGSELKKLQELLEVERESSKNLSLVVNSAITYFGGQSRNINISNIPMNEKLFESLSKIASSLTDARFNALSVKWCEAIEERFDEKITASETMVFERNLQRESEETKRLQEREARQERSKSRTERIKQAVQDAIILYNQFYKESFAKLVDGELLDAEVQDNAKDFVKLFSTYKDGSNLSLSKLIGDVSEDREAQSYMADRIVNMASFLSVIENSRQTIAGSQKVKSMQKYLKSRSAKISAPEGAEVESAIDLMSIVHEEFLKASNLKRGKNDKSPVEIIIEKALKDKDRFALADFQTGTPAREYFDEMLTVSELYGQMESVTDIFEMRAEALWAMQVIKEDHEELTEDYKILCEKLGDTGFAKAMKQVLMPPDEDDFIEKSEETILGFINDKNLSAKDTIKAIREYRKSVIEMGKKERLALLEFTDICNGALIAYNDYYVKYEEDSTNLEKMVVSAKQQVGYKQSQGFLEGLGGRKIDVVRDLETGEERIEGKDEETRDLTDDDLVYQIFGRAIPQPGDIEALTDDKISSANNIFEVVDALKNLKRTSKKWSDELTESYDAVRRLYIQLLLYKKKLEDTRDKMYDCVDYFVENSAEIMSGGPIYLLSEEEAERFAGFVKLSGETVKEDISDYYDDYAIFKFVTGVIDYFNNIEVRSNVDIPAHDYVNIGRVADGITLTDGNDQTRGVIQSISSDWVDACDFEEILKTKDIEQIVANPGFDSLLGVFTPMVELESEIKLCEILTSVKYLVSDEEKEAEVQRRYAINRLVMKLFDATSKGFTQTDGLYEQLLARVPDARRIAKRELSRARKVKTINEKTAEEIIQNLPKTFDPMESIMGERGARGLKVNAETSYKVYKNWLSRLVSIEKMRAEKGHYVKRTDEEREEDKKALECSIDEFF